MRKLSGLLLAMLLVVANAPLVFADEAAVSGAAAIADEDGEAGDDDAEDESEDEDENPAE